MRRREPDIRVTYENYVDHEKNKKRIKDISRGNCDMRYCELWARAFASSLSLPDGK